MILSCVVRKKNDRQRLGLLEPGVTNKAQFFGAVMRIVKEASYLLSTVKEHILNK